MVKGEGIRLVQIPVQPQDKANKQARAKSPGTNDIPLVDERDTRNGYPGYIPVIRPRHDWSELKEDNCVLRKNVNETLTTVIRVDKKVTRENVRRKVYAEVCKL